MTVDEAAKKLNKSHRRIRQLLKSGALKGTAINPRFWLIDRRSVEKYAKLPPPKIGRPKKEKIAC